jgi:hypothetical protein
MKSDLTTNGEKELREIREKIYEEAMAVGWDTYYAKLHKRAGFFFGAFPKRKPSSQLRKMSAVTPEPKAVKEVRSWRQKVQQRAAKMGWEKYLKELGERPGVWVEKPVSVVREKPGKKYGK